MAMTTNTSVEKKYKEYDLDMPAEDIKSILKNTKIMLDDNGTMVGTERLEPGAVTWEKLDGVVQDKINETAEIGGNDTPFAVCTTFPNTPIKTITVKGLSTLTDGQSVRVRFDNTVHALTDGLFLKINNGTAIPIYPNGVDAGTIDNYGNLSLVISGGTQVLTYNVVGSYWSFDGFSSVESSNFVHSVIPGSITMDSLAPDVIAAINSGSGSGTTTIPNMTFRTSAYSYSHTSTDYTITNNVAEKGDTVTIGSVPITVTKGSYTVSSVDLNFSGASASANISDVTNINNNSSYNLSLPLNVEFTSTNNSIVGIVTYDTNKTKTVSGGNPFTFVYPYYYGCVSSSATINASAVKGLTKRVANESQTISFTPSNQYIVFASPSQVTKITDSNNFDYTSSFDMSRVSISCLDGTTQSYYVYKLQNLSTGTFGFTFTI